MNHVGDDYDDRKMVEVRLNASAKTKIFGFYIRIPFTLRFRLH